MKHVIVMAATLAFAAALPAAPAQALNARSFISANGLDTNSCARTAPCRTLQKAHDSTVAGGEINMLDPAGYGTVTITKSISIVNDGVGSAGVLVPSGATGITISAGATDKINLHGLIIEGAGVGSTGILFVTGKTLIIENCIVRNLVSSGIAIGPTVTSNIVVSNTLVADNGGHGIYVQPQSGSVVQAFFNRVEVYNNAQKGIGLFGNLAEGQIHAKAVDSVAGYNETGFYALGGNFQTNFLVFRSVTFASTSPFGILAEGGAEFDVSQSSLDNDNWGVTTGGILFSWGDNYALTAADNGLISKR